MRKCLRATVGADGTVYRFSISSTATVSDACLLISSEFGIRNPVQASIYGSALYPECLLFEVIQPVDVVLFDSSPEDGPITFGFRILERPPISPAHFRVFSSLSLASMTVGDVLPIADDTGPDQLRRQLTDFLDKKFKGLPADATINIFLPGGAPSDRRTLREFAELFRMAQPHIYVVATRRHPPALLQNRVREVVNIKDADVKQLLTPLAGSSDEGLTYLASLLGYIVYGGRLTDLLLYSISRFVPFAPLIAGLYVLAQKEAVYGYTLAQIVDPLHTIVREIFPDRPLEHLLELLPLFTAHQFRETVQCTIFKAPFSAIGYEEFFYDSAAPMIPMFDPDFRELDCVPLVLDSVTLRDANIAEFRPISIMSARRQNRVCFVSLQSGVALVLSSVAAKGNSRDKLTIIDPMRGDRQDRDPEDLARDVGLQNLPRIITVSEVEELVCVAVDCSSSMFLAFDGNVRRFDAAQTFFREFAGMAYRRRLDNIYGLVLFGWATAEELMREVPEEQRAKQFVTKLPMSPIGGPFQAALDDVQACGQTPMWQGINLAIDELLKVRGNYPGVPLRIIVLSDGEADVEDRRHMNHVCGRLVEHSIHVDAIFIGRTLDAGALATAVTMTGGLLFWPKTTAEALSIFQYEPFFRSSMRAWGKVLPIGELPRVKREAPRIDSRVPARQNAFQLKEGPFCEAFLAIAEHVDTPDARGRRIVDELRIMAGASSDDFTVFVCEQDIGQWRVLLRAPENTCYGGWWFQLFIIFPPLYPGNAPIIRFLAPPYHVNIDDLGWIGLPPLHECYDDYLNILDLLEEIRILLMKRRPGRKCNVSDDDPPTPEELADPSKNPLVDPNPIDNAHAEAYADVRRYKQLVEEANQKNGKRNPDEFIEGWEIRRANTQQRRKVAVKQAIPRQYRCTLTGQVMSSPVFSPTTQRYYEKRALAQHLDGNPKAVCPSTGIQFTDEDRNLRIDAKMDGLLRQFRRANR
jgi:ubiquitin-protein ligase